VFSRIRAQSWKYILVAAVVANFALISTACDDSGSYDSSVHCTDRSTDQMYDCSNSNSNSNGGDDLLKEVRSHEHSRIRPYLERPVQPHVEPRYIFK